MELHKYSGAGNKFVVFDGRSLSNEELSSLRSVQTISALCTEHGTDGLMILGNPESADLDFTMEFYNPDGSGGMMCGNGGRCIVAFADELGIRPKGDGFRFTAADGLHTAQILAREGGRKTVRLQMVDVHGSSKMRILGADGYFLNTGTRHFVTFVENVEKTPVEHRGRELRNAEDFKPIGSNINFVEIAGPGSIKVRTFEKGVEGETLACGTGITASAIAACLSGVPANECEGRQSYKVRARIDDLAVDFIKKDGAFVSVHLTGPAEEI